MFKAIDQSRPDKRFAIKIINKAKLQGSSEAYKTLNEHIVLKNLHHPNIVHLCEVIDDANSKMIYIVFMYLTCPTLPSV